MTNPGSPAPLSLIEEYTARIMPALPAFEVFELAARCSDEEIEAMLADRRRFTDGEAYPLIGALIGDQPKGEPDPLSRDGDNMFCTPLFIVCVGWMDSHWAVTSALRHAPTLARGRLYIRPPLNLSLAPPRERT